MSDAELSQLADLVAERVAARIQVPPDYMTTPQAARYLGVSDEYLEIARQKGGGPPFVKIGRAVRYRRIDLDEYLAARLRRNTAESQ